MPGTYFLDKKLVDLLTDTAAYTSPDLYLALFTADPGKSGSLTDEVSGGGYARQSLVGKMGAVDATTGIAVNTAGIDFGVASADWGTVTYVGLADAVSGGNVLIVGALSTPKTITSGLPLALAIGQVRLRGN